MSSSSSIVGMKSMLLVLAAGSLLLMRTKQHVADYYGLVRFLNYVIHFKPSALRCLVQDSPGNMSSRSSMDLERLEDENRVLYHKLSTLEREVKLKNEALTNANARKKELAEELRECKKQQKELLQQVEETSSREMIAKGSA